MLKSASKVTINTGNVLNLIDIKKKAGQNVTEELSESIKLTLSEWGSQNGVVKLQNGFDQPDTSQKSTYAVKPDIVVMSSSLPDEVVVNITRPHDDVQIKMAEEERKNLKIGVKIFINEDSQSALSECLENVITALHTTVIDNVILAYNPDVLTKEQSHAMITYSSKASPISLGSNIVIEENVTQINSGLLMGAFDASPLVPSKVQTDAVITYSDNSSPISLGSDVGTDFPSELEADSEADARKCEAILPGIQVLWAVLEEYVKNGRVNQLGVADVGGGCLYKLHAWAKVKPAIAQINLASCCVVPPSLHAFCRANDVQLLTHADPPDLLSLAALKTLSDAGIGCHNLDWCARYQVHIKCRGVLALKGYICKATLDKQVN